jgi:hypothetical protein
MSIIIKTQKRRLRYTASFFEIVFLFLINIAPITTATNARDKTTLYFTINEPGKKWISPS